MREKGDVLGVPELVADISRYCYQSWHLYSNLISALLTTSNLYFQHQIRTQPSPHPSDNAPPKHPMSTSRTFTLFRSLHFQFHKAAQPWLHKTTSKPDLPLTRTHISNPWHCTGLNRGYATLTTGSGDEASHRIWDGNTNGNISNDQVARLAARRLHPLALGDLVR